jgi:predicted phosphohydrolase
MKVFAIADLHLSRSGEKPMDIFGPQWAAHHETVEAKWRRAVSEDDLVLLPGDLSWALTLEEALPDLAFIDSLPGHKVFIRGNHDFWFVSPGKVRAVLGPKTQLVRFDATAVGGVGICGVRGWLWPGSAEFKPEDQKYWNREIARLRLSLAALERLEWEVAVAMFHFPPLNERRSSEMCEMIRAAGVRYAVYGHLHGEANRHAFEGERDGVVYRCVSADKVDFAPALVFEHARPAAE